MLSAQNIARPRPGGQAHVSPEGIIYCTDGKYRWVYEIDQRRHPTLLFPLLWVLMAAGGVCGALPLLLDMGSPLLPAGGLLLGGLAALAVFAGHILRSGPMLCLLFTADEDMISCQRVRGKNDKKKVTHAIAVWVGGQSQPALRFYEAEQIRFSGVSSIHPIPHRDLIRVGGLAVRAEPEQFPLVLNYLRARCPQAK